MKFALKIAAGGASELLQRSTFGKRRSTPVSVLIMVCFCWVLTQPSVQAQFYVSPVGNDSWSGRLKQPSQARTDGPFASLSRGIIACRTSKDKKLIVRAGTYRLTEPLKLTTEDSGIQITNQPSERPVISGGIMVTGWTRGANGIWSAPVPDSALLPVRLLRANDHYLWPSRFPALGKWLIAQRSGPGTPRAVDRVAYRMGAIKNYGSIDGAQLVIFPADGWVNEILSITDIDRNASIIATTFPRNGQPILEGNRFYLQNIKDELKDPGTWCFVPSENVLYIIPPAGMTKPPRTVVPACSSLIEIAGDADFAHDIAISGFEFRDTACAENPSPYTPFEAACRLSRAQKCSITGNHFITLGGYAIRLDKSSQNNVIAGNVIEEVGAGGIVLTGNSQDQPKQNKIRNNTIRKCGVVYKHVSGICIASAAGTIVTQNNISGMPRYGVSIASANPQSISTKNEVRKNVITDTNLETSDSGAVEILGRAKIDTGDIIADNIISNTGGFTTDKSGSFKSSHMTWGVYLDDFASGITISGNVLDKCGWAGVMIHGGRNNTMTNNLFSKTPRAQVMIEAIKEDPSFMKGNSFSKNIVVLPETSSSLLDSRRGWSAASFSLWNRNVYWCPAGKSFMETSKLTPAGNLKAWQSLGFDTSSLVADPQLNNFEFPSGSAPFNLGIKPFTLPSLAPLPQSTTPVSGSKSNRSSDKSLR